jgi:hypothetical protein
VYALENAVFSGFSDSSSDALCTRSEAVPHCNVGASGRASSNESMYMEAKSLLDEGWLRVGNELCVAFFSHRSQKVSAHVFRREVALKYRTHSFARLLPHINQAPACREKVWLIKGFFKVRRL